MNLEYYPRLYMLREHAPGAAVPGTCSWSIILGQNLTAACRKFPGEYSNYFLTDCAAWGLKPPTDIRFLSLKNRLNRHFVVVVVFFPKLFRKSRPYILKGFSASTDFTIFSQILWNGTARPSLKDFFSMAMDFGEKVTHLGGTSPQAYALTCKYPGVRSAPERLSSPDHILLI